MQKELEEQINDEKNGNEINLTGEVKMEEIKKKNFKCFNI